jgi:AcrR family transcriptional regulator
MTTPTTPVVTPAVGTDVSTRPNQRQRIIDAALQLMSEQGAGATSMRQLARACGLNVAAIYHYFPSKADLLRSVIEERQYNLRLRELPVLDRGLPPQKLLAGLIEEMWLGSIAEEPIWRLLLGESLRGEENAVAVSAELLHAIEQALSVWLAELFPELEARAEAAVALIMGQLYTAFMEHLFLPDRDLLEVRRRAELIASLVFPAVS